MPATYPGLGLIDAAPLVNAGINPADLALTPQDFFVLTRIDGKTTFRDVVIICGLPEKQTVAVLVKLRGLGAIYLPGETPPPPPPKKARAKASSQKVDPVALAEDNDLSHEQRLAILEKENQLRGASPYQVLEVTPNADRRAIRLAYFRLSKEFHPDRFFGKRLGSFEKRLATIFEMLARAFELNEETTPGPLPMNLPELITANLTPAERTRAAEMFDDACQEQVMGDPRAALARFQKAVALAPFPRYLRRASEAALTAGELTLAEEYAKKAVGLDTHHAGGHRILAKVLRALGQLAPARRALEDARRLDPSNAQILRELEDLP